MVTTELYPFSGGIGVYADQSGTMLAAGGVDATVLLHDSKARWSSVERRGGYRLIRFSTRTLTGELLPAPQLHGALATAFATSEFLKALIADEGAPDILEFQDYGATGYFFLKHRLMAMAPGAPPRVVLTAHRPYVHCAATDDESLFDHRTVFLGDAERWCYAAADAVLAPCGFIIEALRRLDFPLRDADLHVVANPFDPETIARAPADPLALGPRLELERRAHGPDEPILFFGKLQAQKGPWELVASLAALAGERQARTLWMWGRDAFHSPSGTTTYDFLEQRYRRLFQSGRVRYFGDYGLATLRALGASHPVCLVPYREECLPYAVIEMALCGALPVVGARGGQVELIPQALRETLVVDVARPDQLGARIDALQALAAPDRRRLSDTLKAHVIGMTGHAAVLPHKLAALERVRAQAGGADYPFVYGPSKVFGPMQAGARAALAQAVPQRGATVALAAHPAAVTPGADRDPAAGRLVSVIIPYFEMADHIEETLRSVEGQSHDAIEVVIVDDGSYSDAARAKLAGLVSTPRRFPVTLLRKYNGGLADARNAGARVARGDYLYFLDADDLIHSAMVAQGLAVLERFANVAYVGAWLREIEGGERQWLAWDIDSPYLGFHNLQICAFLIRAEAWLRFGVNDPEMSLGMEDYESHLRMLSNGVRGVSLPCTLFSYRIRAGSMSRAFNPHVQAFLYRRIAQANPGFFARHGAQLALMAAENGHGAFATPPTEETPAHAALLPRDLPSLDEVEHELEAHASRERLGRALRARAYHGGPAWDYATGRLLLALDQEADWAERLLAGAARRAPENDWFRLYAIIAHLRAGRFAQASALGTPGFSRFCRAQLDALRWICGLEGVRGYPHVHRAFCSLLRPQLGPAPLGRVDHAADGEPGGASDGADPRFALIRQALATLLAALKTEASPERRAQSLEAASAAAESLVSPEAAEALVRRWVSTWTEAGLLDGQARDAGEQFWRRASTGYAGRRLAAQLERAALDDAERRDARSWLDACPGPAAARRPLTARLGRLGRRLGLSRR